MTDAWAWGSTWPILRLAGWGHCTVPVVYSLPSPAVASSPAAESNNTTTHSLGLGWAGLCWDQTEMHPSRVQLPHLGTSPHHQNMPAVVGTSVTSALARRVIWKLVHEIFEIIQFCPELHRCILQTLIAAGFQHYTCCCQSLVSSYGKSLLSRAQCLFIDILCCHTDEEEAAWGLC